MKETRTERKLNNKPKKSLLAVSEPSLPHVSAEILSQKHSWAHL